MEKFGILVDYSKDFSSHIYGDHESIDPARPPGAIELGWAAWQCPGQIAVFGA
jgi:hypothetical protein